jgi:hypothetical protein
MALTDPWSGDDDTGLDYDGIEATFGPIGRCDGADDAGNRCILAAGHGDRTIILHDPAPDPGHEAFWDKVWAGAS